MAREIWPALKESVQAKQALLLGFVAVAHGLHEGDMLAHHHTQKTAEAWSGPECFEGGLKIGTQQRPHYRAGPLLPIFHPQFREWIGRRCALLYCPVQETVDKASAFRDLLKSPHPALILEPLSYCFLRYGFVLRMLGNESLESAQG